MKIQSKEVVGQPTFPDVVDNGAVVIFRVEVDNPKEDHDVVVRDQNGRAIDLNLFLSGNLLIITFKATNNSPSLGRNELEVEDQEGHELTYSFPVERFPVDISGPNHEQKTH